MSVANAVAGTMQAGYTVLGLNQRAAMWAGSAASYVDLHPAGAVVSDATATDGVDQGGYAEFPSPGGLLGQAIIWHGSATGYTNLSPTIDHGSKINGMAPGVQVGRMNIPLTPGHAALWRGTAQSFLDLNPPGAGTSEALGTNGIAQVGWANLPGLGPTAGIWFSTAASYVPLEPYLPPGYAGSIATSVSFFQGQFYVGGYARNLITDNNEAMLWVGIPAPGTVWVLAGLGLCAARRSRTGYSRCLSA